MCFKSSINVKSSNNEEWFWKTQSGEDVTSIKGLHISNSVCLFISEKPSGHFKLSRKNDCWTPISRDPVIWVAFIPSPAIIFLQLVSVTFVWYISLKVLPCLAVFIRKWWLRLMFTRPTYLAICLSRYTMCTFYWPDPLIYDPFRIIN